MDLAAFFTTRLNGAPVQGTQQTAAQNAPLGAALSGVEGGGQSQAGFFDVILAQLASELDPEKSQNAAQTNSEDKTDNTLNLASLLADNPDVQKRIDANQSRVNLGLGAEIQQALVLNQQVNDEILLPLGGDTVRDGLSIPDAVNGDAPPGAAISAFDDILTTEITQDAPSLASILNGISVGGGEKGVAEIEDLSASGLTPAQITRLQDLQAEGQELQEAYAAQNSLEVLDEAIDKLFQSDVTLAPPTALQVGEEIVIPPQALPFTTRETAPAQQQQLSANDVAARLNSLIVGGSADDALVTSDLNSVSNKASGDFDGEFDAILREFGGKPANNAPAGAQTPATNTPAPQANAAAPALSFFQGEAFASNGMLFSPSSFSNESYDSLGAAPLGQSSALSANNPAALLTHAHSAAQAHPATQLVAATLQRAGANGQDTNITLRLDPAELGRVDVRLQFGADKNLKTVIRVENQDTFNLLQRDAQILERALMDAGIDVDEGISFELSQDGDFGGNDNERGGGHDSGGTGAGGESGDEEILETTMNWHIDPESGHTRYDLLV